MYSHPDASDARQLELLLRDDTVEVSSRNRQVMVVQTHAQRLAMIGHSSAPATSRTAAKGGGQRILSIMGLVVALQDKAGRTACPILEVVAARGLDHRVVSACRMWLELVERLYCNDLY